MSRDSPRRINYLNKALELFNTSMVVPVYFCYFSTATLVTSFILYQGLKASAVTLVTMVLGFLVICLGITLLQMSKVDPKALSKLDRRSTMLLEAGRHPTENEEKGEVSAMEDPGMDALRGGFGAVGSIIRARSVSRRLSNASSLGGGTPGSRKWSIGGGGGGGSSSNGGLSTHGLPALQRYQRESTFNDAESRADGGSVGQPDAVRCGGQDLHVLADLLAIFVCPIPTIAISIISTRPAKQESSEGEPDCLTISRMMAD